LEKEEVITLFDSDKDEGLGVLEIKNRRDFFGENVLKAKKEDSKLKQFFIQFHSALIYILLAASIVTGALGEWVDSGVIFGVVIVNVIVGYIQEVRATEAIKSLKKMMKTTAIVIRDGKKESIDSTFLVPGDIVLFESGSKIPADIRVLNTTELRVDESMLTGESLPVQKNCDKLPPDITINDRKNMLYSGTFVTYGRAKGVVVATGMNTEIGKIANLMEETASMQTPLTKKIDSFSKLLLYVILTLAGFTFVVGVLRSYEATDMFLSSVALAVGAIPEGLPAAVTITLAIGVSAMARKNAIIRKLPAVETLGSVTTICSDKTGTLTQNKMSVTTLYCDNKIYNFSGEGYEPSGSITLEGTEIKAENGALFETLLGGYLCNESYLVKKEGGYEINGDPTEGALIVAALKGGVDEYKINEKLERIDILPFESDRRYMGVIYQDKTNGEKTLYIKGSVERVLELCTKELGEYGNSEIKKDEINQKSEEFAKDGLRVLAIAKKVANTESIATQIDEGGFVFLGCEAMIDRPRGEAIEAVAECKKAGINIIMITGDHAHTAFSIAKQMGIADKDAEFKDSVITGKELFEISDSELLERVKDVKVYARVEPEQKLRIVDALQARGEIVAMTGDGVNDAPALKQADIGVAMGKGGTEVAKEAADMVLSDDNFASIAHAVKEGRGVFDNLVKFITWTLPTNLGEGMVIMVAIILGVTLPISPVQILWINMSTAIMLGMMLVFEPHAKNIMDRAPREPDSPILSTDLVVQMMLVGTYMLIVAYGMFTYYIDAGYSIEYARTVAVNVFVFTEMFFLFCCKELDKSIFKTDIFNNKYLILGVVLMILSQILFTHTPFMQTMFRSESLELWTWIKITILTFGVIFVIELKHLYSKITASKKIA